MNFLRRAQPFALGLLWGVFLLGPALAMAAEPTPPPAPIPVLKLNDGRVFHNVQVKKDQPDSLLVLADEGLLKISKSSLPPALASTYPVRLPPAGSPDMVMPPFNPNPNQTALPLPGNKLAPRPTPVPTRSQGVYKGCTIVSFEQKAFQTSLGCAEVVIRNDTDEAVVIYPGEIICVTTNGVRRPGRLMVVDGDTPSIRRQETVPAHGDVKDIVTFTNEALDISYVLWAR
jgi:hypothetical protein